MLCCIFGGFTCVLFFGISISTYDVVLFRSCLEVAADTIDRILSIFLLGAIVIFSFVEPAVVIFVVVLSISLRNIVESWSVGQLIYANGIFDCFLHDTTDFGSSSDDLVQWQSTVAEFRVAFGGQLLVGG